MAKRMILFCIIIALYLLGILHIGEIRNTKFGTGNLARRMMLKIQGVFDCFDSLGVYVHT